MSRRDGSTSLQTHLVCSEDQPNDVVGFEPVVDAAAGSAERRGRFARSSQINKYPAHSTRYGRQRSRWVLFCARQLRHGQSHFASRSPVFGGDPSQRNAFGLEQDDWGTDSVRQLVLQRARNSAQKLKWFIRSCQKEGQAPLGICHPTPYSRSDPHNANALGISTPELFP